MMADELPVILSWPLLLQAEHDGLLGPIAGLNQVVTLEERIVSEVRILFVKGRGVEIPHWGPAHHVQAKRAKDGEVDGGVDLLHHSALFGARSDAHVDCPRPDHALHEKFASEGEDDDIEGHKGEIACALVVEDWAVGLVGGVSRNPVGEGRKCVREEEELVNRIRGRGIESVEGEDCNDESQGIDPGMADGEVSPAAEEGAGFTALRGSRDRAEGGCLN